MRSDRRLNQTATAGKLGAGCVGQGHSGGEKNLPQVPKRVLLSKITHECRVAGVRLDRSRRDGSPDV